MDSRFLDVNQHGVLRVPPLLWVALALLARYWVLLIVVGVSMRRNSDAARLLSDGISWPLVLMELPAFVVAWVCGRRLPEASTAVRFIWRHGRLFMAATALANLVWTASFLAASVHWSPWPELLLASCSLLDVTIVLAMYTNPFFQQLFREFPPRPTEGAAP